MSVEGDSSRVAPDRRRPGGVTLHDVAATAGVSKSTVSRVLDERLPRSGSSTAERVRRAAAELGYSRDISAASLRRGKTLTVGVVVPRLTDTVMAMLFEQIAYACQDSGRFAVVATTGDEPEAERRAVEGLLQRRVDGLVLTTARSNDDYLQQLTARGVPFVLALRTDGQSRASVGDDELGGYLATRHLLDLGHKRVGLIAGPQYASSARGRVRGYRSAMAEGGVEVCDEWVVESTFGIESGAEAAARLLAQRQPPTAVFAINDNTALGALSAIHAAGLTVPEDLSLVGYNDIPLVGMLPTPLTTVRVPFDQIARAALDLLLNDDADAVGRVRVAAPTLIPRRSTARVDITGANLG